jgi:dCMP deaminase
MAVAVISYIPALHEGYLKFFREHPGKLLVLGKELVLESPELKRDIRALEPAIVAKMVESTHLMSSVEVLDSASGLAETLSADEVVMPDEDVSRKFAAAYLEGVKVTFVSIFLRWDMSWTSSQNEVPPDRIISSSERDKELIGQAFSNAHKSADWWRQIGALIERHGEVLLAGYNRPTKADVHTLGAFGDPRSNFNAGQGIDLSTALHAEAGLISEAAKRGLAIEGASFYVTTFPCPMCAKSIAAAGIMKVYYSQGYSLLDAEDILKAHGVELILVQNEKTPSA